MAKIKNPVTIVKSGGATPTLVQKTFTQNGTYAAADETPPADGYDEVVVNVPPTLFRQIVDGSITNVTKEDLGSITKIRNDSFEDCASLQSIEFPDTILSIDAYAFNRCTSLTSVVIPNSVTTLGRASFQNCSAIIFVLIGSGVTSIADYSFANTRAKYILLPENPPQIDRQSVSTSSYARYYTRNPSTYRTATNWTLNASRIFPLVATVADLDNIDTTTYTKACVVGSDESYKEYAYDGSAWNIVT